MTDPVPNGSELCTHGEELHAYCDKCASEQRPSKDLCSQLRALTGGNRLLGYTAAEEIERLQRRLQAAEDCENPGRCGDPGCTWCYPSKPPRDG